MVNIGGTQSDIKLNRVAYDKLRELTKRLKKNNITRKLRVRQEKFFVPSTAMAPTEESERARQNAERELAKLETERVRIEMERRQQEMEKKYADLEQTVKSEKAEQTKKIELAEQANKAELAELQRKADQLELTKKMELAEIQRKSQISDLEKKTELAELKRKAEDAERAIKDQSSPLSKVRDLQFLIVGGIGLIAVLAAFYLIGMSLRQGMNSVGQGIGTVGKSMVEAVSTKVAGDATAREKAEKTEEEANEANGTKDLGGAGNDLEKTPDAAMGWIPGKPEFEDYIERIQEKIQALGRDRSYVFVRELADMIEDDTKLPLAAAILLAVPAETAKALVQDLSPQHLQRLRQTMASPGGLAGAKSLKRTALQEFFGRIAVAEFSDSPLMTMRNATWLTRLTSAQLVEVALSCTEDQRPAFLACLSPVRVKRLIAAATNAENKSKLVRALGQIPQVTSEMMRKFIDEASSSEVIQEKLASLQIVTDGAEYFGAVADDLSEEDQQIMLASAGSNPEAQKRLRNMFLPFSSIQRVPKELLKEIFESRNASQISIILFASNQAVRDHVLSALPNIKADGVRDELKVMDAQPLLAPKNRKSSLKVQKDITRYMMRMANDGLISLEDGDASSETTGEQSKLRSVSGAA